MQDSAIHIENLKFRWSLQEDPLINLPELKCHRGEKIFIQGSSGSGKSTLLNLISGVLSPSSGKIKLLNHNFSEMSQSQRDVFRGDHIGFVFQQFNLIPFLNVFENIYLSADFSKIRAAKVSDPTEEVSRLLESLELDPKVYMQKPVTELSVGQQQRVAVARAMYGSPEILIADEPTSALDHNTRNRFIELLLKETARSNSAVLFVSHDPTLTDHFDRVETLRDRT